jgi:hypothetical protein
MEDLDHWDGAIQDRSDEAELDLVVVETEETKNRRGDGGSKPVIVRASDGNSYWLKPVNNNQGEMVPVTEQIVGRAGQLIGAPVAGVRTIYIPPEAEGQASDVQKNYKLKEGIAHGSRDVGVADLHNGTPNHYNEDRNDRRFAFLVALYDWCWGGDPQYLRADEENLACCSHDHGWFLPPRGKNWSQAKMQETCDQARPLDCDEQEIDRGAVKEAVEALRNVDTSDVLQEVLIPIPEPWVSTEKLEAVGRYLEYRAPATADRLENRFQL